MQTLSLLDSQKAVVTAQPEDAAGNPASNFNPAVWSISDPTIGSFTNVSSDGLTATVVAGKVGTATVTVTGHQGNGLPAFSTDFSLVVGPGLPTQFNYVFGAPASQP